MDTHTKRRSTERPRLKARIWPRTSSVTTVIFSIPGGVYWELIAVKKAAGSETATTLHQFVRLLKVTKVVCYCSVNVRKR